MVPTIRPSPNTSILAPTRCGVDPCVATIVTSAAGSPRSSASATAAKTSWFMPSELYESKAVEPAPRDGFGPGPERLVEHTRASGGGELAGVRVDVREAHLVGDLEPDARVSGQRTHHELRPDGQRRLRAAQADRLVVVESDPHDGQQLRREPHEPRVAQIVGRTCLARGGQRETCGASAGA